MLFAISKASSLLVSNNSGDTNFTLVKIRLNKNSKSNFDNPDLLINSVLCRSNSSKM